MHTFLYFKRWTTSKIHNKSALGSFLTQKLTNDAINLQKSIKFQQEPNFLDYIFSFTDAMDIMKLDTNGWTSKKFKFSIPYLRFCLIKRTSTIAILVFGWYSVNFNSKTKFSAVSQFPKSQILFNKNNFNDNAMSQS